MGQDRTKVTIDDQWEIAYALSARATTSDEPIDDLTCISCPIHIHECHKTPPPPNSGPKFFNDAKTEAGAFLPRVAQYEG